MSPTIVREGGFRLFFFSREEPRMHVHAASADGEAKFWIEPIIELADSVSLNSSELGKIEAIVRVHEDEIRAAWKRHFGR